MTMTLEPKIPQWPINVMVFKPPKTNDDVDAIKKQIVVTEDPITTYTDQQGNTATTHNSKHHFSTKRFALLFTPGEYKDCKFEVGYYVQMAGLGRNAKGDDAVRFTGNESGPYVPALNKDLPFTEGGSIADTGSGLCLDTFWRAAENFSAENTQWAVSQAAPLRRVCVSNTLMCGDGAAYSSGGFVANAEVGRQINFAANQQWLSRAVDIKGEAAGGAWNIVYSGCTGNVPANNSNGGVVTTEVKPRVRIEKPFIVINTMAEYELHVPKSTSDHTIGSHLDDSNNEIRCFSNVKVGKAFLHTDEYGQYSEIPDTQYNDITERDKRITMELQQALDDGKDLVLSPGIYFLTQSLIVRTANQVVLGLGLATLHAPQDGSPCIRVIANTAGVRIAGLMLEASVHNNVKSDNNNSDGVSSLLDFGEPEKNGTKDVGDSNNPGLISDIFTRVGGSNPDRSVTTDVMIRVFSGNVCGDNLWLWRADHVKLAPDEKPNSPPLDYHQVRIFEKNDGKIVYVNECMVDNAIIVYGDNVSMYGLFCEHTVKDQMIWKGEHGSVTFFQCELPYDVMEYPYAGYYVHEDVDHHSGAGFGVYTNFTCANVMAPHGLKFPDKENILIQNPMTRFLNGMGGQLNVLREGETPIGEASNTSNKLSRGWIGLGPK
mmetsp:Transcript_50448/g.58301  ORF Transcript_50448/g.58301 Transcript_50448/m.58301 type:complete len:658 (-) Transcript_50448:27-2000(-)